MTFEWFLFYCVVVFIGAKVFALPLAMTMGIAVAVYFFIWFCIQSKVVGDLLEALCGVFLICGD
jgi:uncharacterized membrane protein